MISYTPYMHACLFVSPESGITDKNSAFCNLQLAQARPGKNLNVTYKHKETGT